MLSLGTSVTHARGFKATVIGHGGPGELLLRTSEGAKLIVSSRDVTPDGDTGVPGATFKFINDDWHRVEQVKPLESANAAQSQPAAAPLSGEPGSAQGAEAGNSGASGAPAAVSGAEQVP